MVKRVGIFFAAATFAAVCAVCLEFSERFLPPGALSLVARVEAIVGRPLTPVSVAGVARRTSRRCVTGVYDC